MDAILSSETASVEVATSTPASAGPKPDNMGRARLVVAAVILTLGLGLGMARAANKAGWVPHREDTTVYFGHSNWAVGEERSCIALPESDGAIIFLSCVARSNPELSPEVWPVTYWGQTHRRDMFEYVHANPGMHTWDWRCRRQRNSVTCWAVN
jgi:hypothetical protein